MPNEVSLVISTEGLMALAEMALASRHQDRLDQLLEKKFEAGTLRCRGSRTRFAIEKSR
jgi:hypothetical protein